MSEPSPVNGFVYKKMQISESPAVFTSVIGYTALLFLKCSLALSATCFLVGNVMSGRKKQRVIQQERGENNQQGPWICLHLPKLWLFHHCCWSYLLPAGNNTVWNQEVLCQCTSCSLLPFSARGTHIILLTCDVSSFAWTVFDLFCAICCVWCLKPRNLSELVKTRPKSMFSIPMNVKTLKFSKFSGS